MMVVLMVMVVVVVTAVMMVMMVMVVMATLVLLQSLFVPAELLDLQPHWPSDLPAPTYQ